MRMFLGVLIVSILAAGSALAESGQEREGYVLRVEDRLAFLDLGTQDNMYPDRLLQIVRRETFVHPVTGEDIGNEVPVGAVRVVEVFPRLSTAEVVELAHGMDLKTLNKEARQGIIRVKPMSKEMAAALQKRLHGAPSQEILHPGGGGAVNPDGPIRSLVPYLRVQTGKSLASALPDSVFKLLSAGKQAMAVDTLDHQPLRNLNSKHTVQFSLLVPVSSRFSAMADIQVGSRSLETVGGRIYPGALPGFSGKGRNPDGQVGEPSIRFSVGIGSQGARSLPSDVKALIQARRDSAFVAGLDSTYTGGPIPASLDTVLNRITVDTLQAEAEQSVKRAVDRGFGFSLGLSFPVSKKFTIRGGMARFGNIREFSGGLTYYSKNAEPGMDGVNPDGAIRSLVLALDATRDTQAGKTFVDLGLKVPASPVFTLGADFVSDLGSFYQVGISMKGYVKGF